MDGEHNRQDIGSADLVRLAEERRIFEEAIRLSPVHFCVFDHRDRLIAWNAAYEARYAQAFAAMRDRADRRQMTYSDLLRFQLSRTLSAEQVETEVARRVAIQRQADGAPQTRDYGDVTLNVYKYRLPSGAVASVGVDVTELVERERQLCEARRKAEHVQRARAAFLANMSHEIRTPMNGIIGLASLLGETGLTDEQQAMVQTILDSADTLMATINDILDFSKIDAGKLELVVEPFDLRRMMRGMGDLLRPVAQAKGVALRLDYPEDVPDLYAGDMVRLRQCLINLVGNAIKFTAKGEVVVAVARHGDAPLRIRVSDTGVGIAPENIGRIFSAFEQEDSRRARKVEGTGLGLAITRRLVEMMSGTIEVTSTLGKGSTFTIGVPLAPVSGPRAAAIAGAGAEAAGTGDFSHVEILLAEDNSTNRLVFERMVGPTGATLRTAADGRAAVEAFRDGAPDIVFMDMSMPVMGGLDATREIRRIEAERGAARTPVVALTANAMTEDRKLCLDAGMDRVLTKPVRRAEIVATLDDLLGAAPVAGRLIA